jgi:Family of unknown function (DUF6518)
MTLARRISLVLLASVAFGILAAVIKGGGAGPRDALGNLSAPWMAVAFAAGAAVGSVRRGAVLGVAATLAGLGAFYVTQAFTLDLGTHDLGHRLALTAGTFNFYERLGVISGVVYGALGGLWRTRPRLACAALGLAFIGEPLLVDALARAQVWDGGGLFRYPALVAAEVVVGVSLVIVSLARRTVRARP